MYAKKKRDVNMYNKVKLKKKTCTRGLVRGLARPLGERVQAKGRLHLRSCGLGHLEREKCSALLRRSDTINAASGLHQAPRRTLGGSRCQGSWKFNAGSSTLVVLVLGVGPVFVASYSESDRSVKTFIISLNTKTRKLFA